MIDAKLLDAETFRAGAPHALFARMRAEAPVCWQPEPAGPGFWALTKHADVLAVSRDSATFSSARAGYMTQDMDPAAVAQSRLMLLGMDPPEHTRLRGLVNKGFTPRRVARLEKRIRELSASIVDAVAERGACDFVSEVSGELPSLLIAELMGIPPDDGRRLYELTERMHQSGAPTDAQAAVLEMLRYSAGVRVPPKAARRLPSAIRLRFDRKR